MDEEIASLNSRGTVADVNTAATARRTLVLHPLLRHWGAIWTGLCFLRF